MPKISQATRAKIVHACEKLAERCTIGFEVETKLRAGDSEVDHDAMRDHASDSITDYEICSYAGVPHDRRWIRALGVEDDCSNLADLLGVDISEVIDQIVENMDESDYQTDSDGMGFDALTRFVKDNLERNDIEGWTHCRDGSVDGPEFQSPILEGRGNAMKHAKRLFRAIEESDGANIDSGCSCHIHIRMKDVFHTGCNAIQQLLFEEVFNRLDKLPQSVKTRCASRNRCIEPNSQGYETCKYKFNPIQCHSQGTWEFRLFGNIDNVIDFTKCLDVALRSMVVAYQRYLKDDFEVLEASKWAETARTCMRSWKSVKEVLENASVPVS